MKSLASLDSRIKNRQVAITCTKLIHKQAVKLTFQQFNVSEFCEICDDKFRSSVHDCGLHGSTISKVAPLAISDLFGNFYFGLVIFTVVQFFTRRAISASHCHLNELCACLETMFMGSRLLGRGDLWSHRLLKCADNDLTSASISALYVMEAAA